MYIWYMYIGSMKCEVVYNKFHRRYWIKVLNYTISYENIECWSLNKFKLTKNEFKAYIYHNIRTNNLFKLLHMILVPNSN